MKRWSLSFWNDWRYVERGVADITVLRLNADYLRSHYASVDVVLLGFGFSLTYIVDPATVDWVPVESLGRDALPKWSVNGEVQIGRVEPFGKEHAP